MIKLGIPANADNKVVAGENAMKNVSGEATLTATDRRDHEWRRVSRSEWSDGEVDIISSVYNTYQAALDDVGYTLGKLYNEFKDKGYNVADVRFNIGNGIGELTLAEGSVFSQWIENNK